MTRTSKIISCFGGGVACVFFFFPVVFVLEKETVFL